MNVVWYLIIAFYSNGGVATIPQPSREACNAQATWLQEHRRDDFVPLYAYCVYGAPTQVVQR